MNYRRTIKYSITCSIVLSAFMSLGGCNPNTSQNTDATRSSSEDKSATSKTQPGQPNQQPGTQASPNAGGQPSMGGAPGTAGDGNPPPTSGP